MIILSSILLLIPLVISVPESCFLPEMRDEMRNCINRMIPKGDNLRRAMTGTFNSPNITRDILEYCDISLRCFKTLQVCAGIDKNLILNLEGVCDLYDFKSGKFKDCYQKIGTNSYDNCVYDFFMDPVYTDASTNRERCKNLKTNGNCVKGKAQSMCSKDFANDFKDELDDQYKRFSCK